MYCNHVRGTDNNDTTWLFPEAVETEEEEQTIGREKEEFILASRGLAPINFLAKFFLLLTLSWEVASQQQIRYS